MRCIRPATRGLTAFSVPVCRFRSVGRHPMKFASAFLVVFVFGAFAQTPSAPVVIKDECGLVLSLEFSPNGGELARFCFGYNVVLLIPPTTAEHARSFRKRSIPLRCWGLHTARTGPLSQRCWGAARKSGTPRTQVSRYPRKNRFWYVDVLYALDTPLRVLEARHRSGD